MTSLARWCFTHRRTVVGLWLLALLVVLALAEGAGSRFNSNFNLPHTDSQAAVSLLKQNFPAASGEDDQIVFQTDAGTTVRYASERKAVAAIVRRASQVPGVESVTGPYSRGGQISRDGHVAFSTVTWARGTGKVTDADARNLIATAAPAGSADLHVYFSGDSISSQETAGPGLSETVAVVAALLILLLVFGGALFASIMPLLTALLALGIGTSVIDLMTHAFDVADVSSDLAVLIGLGVGVDYGLFIMSRYRNAVKAGRSYVDAAAEAVNTSGRTVLFAGITVCIALLGQFALGVTFLYGLSLSSAIAVALTMATSLTFLPAMLGFLGPKVLSRRERAALTTNGPRTDAAAGFWLRWARLVAAHRTLVAAGSLGIMIAIALPVFGLRLGSSDGSTDPTGSTTHHAFTALSAGFGPGLTGPLELAGHIANQSQTAAFQRLVTHIDHLNGVAAVTPAITSPNHRAALAVVYPTTSPQNQRTVDLVNHLRNDIIPSAETGTGLRVHVGGQTATNIDFSHVLAQKLPIFIAIVVLLAFLLLMAVFRSLLIPLVAAVMNLLSVGAALGGLNAVFNWGWGASIIGLSGTGPIDAFIPVLLFSVLFGLSMDYEVYLVSRMQEQWQQNQPQDDPNTRSGDPTPAWRNHTAVIDGQAQSERIIIAAATIMILVFGSFLLNGSRLLQEFGFGLGFAVLVDALIIRTALVPALMHLIGARNWYLPRRLARVLPDLSIEAAEQSAPPRTPRQRPTPVA